MKKLWCFAFLIFINLAFSGCSSVGHNFDSRKISEIKKGETTETDLIAAFGQPDQRGYNSEKGTVWTWLYTQATVKGATFIPLVGAFAGGVDTKNKTLVVYLDDSGKVSSFSYSGGGFESTGMTQPDPENSNPTPKAPVNRR